MKRLYLTVAIGFFAVGSLFAGEPNSAVTEKNVSVYEVIGQGKDKDAAIKNALYMAVSQARGVKVGSGSYYSEFGYAGADVEVDTQAGHKKIDFDAVKVETSGTAYTTEIGGLVKTYKILEEKKQQDGTYSVKMNVWVYNLTPGGSKRVKVAIMPFKVMADAYNIGPTEVPAEKLSAILSQKIAVAMVGTNKFNVLDREYVVDFAREKHLLLASEAPLSELAKLTETLGADYLMVGNISDVRLEKKEYNLAAAGQTVEKWRARFVFNYRLIAGTTKEIILAGVVDKYLENEEIRALSREWNSENWDFAEIRDGIAALVAQDVVSNILDHLYPIKVASVEGNQVIIDQGEGSIKEGMLLDVFSQGKEFFDPDTKESLGKLESLVATIKITKVAQKISYSDVVEGDKSRIEKGLICRVKSAKKEEPGAKPDIKRTESGGVILPFDKK
jgi:curli biogenesis system outer membrane secretion channel CsgG